MVRAPWPHGPENTRPPPGGSPDRQMILVELAGHDKIVREHEALKKAAKDLLKAFDSLLPGIKFISVQDYQLLNEAPMNMRALLEKE